MDEDTRAIETPEKETQDSPMPSEEQKTSEPEAQPQIAENELPIEAKERTRHEFDKLQQQLREERQRREALEGAFSTLKPQEQQTQVVEPIYDPETGYIDPNALEAMDRRTREAEQRAIKAEQIAQQITADRERAEAYSVHPELNPDDTAKFDKELFKRARAIVLDSMMNPQDYDGKQLSLKEAGSYLKAPSSAAVAEAKAEGAKEALEKLTPKEQASLDQVGSSNARSQTLENLENLKRQSRRGNAEAIMERLKNLKQE